MCSLSGDAEDRDADDGGAESESKAVTRIGEMVIDFGIFPAAAFPIKKHSHLFLRRYRALHPGSRIPFSQVSAASPAPESATWNKISDAPSASSSEIATPVAPQVPLLIRNHFKSERKTLSWQNMNTERLLAISCAVMQHFSRLKCQESLSDMHSYVVYQEQPLIKQTIWPENSIKELHNSDSSQPSSSAAGAACSPLLCLSSCD